MSSSGAVRAKGARLRIGVGATPVWTTLVGVEEFDFPDQTRGRLDATHLGSPGDTGESIPDMKPETEWSVDIHYVPGSTTDVLLKGLEDTNEDIQLGCLPMAGATERIFGAYVLGYTPTGLSNKKIAKARLTLAVSAEIVA